MLQNENEEVETKKSLKNNSKKHVFKLILKVVLNIVFLLLLFISWNLRKEIIVGPVPMVIHLAIFFGIFRLINGNKIGNNLKLAGIVLLVLFILLGILFTIIPFL